MSKKNIDEDKVDGILLGINILNDHTDGTELKQVEIRPKEKAGRR